MNDVFVARKKDEIPDSLESISNALIGHNLEQLDLSNNAVGENGAKCLTKYLSQASSLRVFFISNCGLGIDGATYLSDAMKKGTINLESFAIARNRIENAVAKQIAEAVKSMKKLKELHIYQNFIQNE